MQITIDSETITLEQFNGLSVLLGFGSISAEEVAPAAKAPAKKATPAKKAAAPAPEPEVEDGPTLDDAVAKATEMVGEERTDEVKAALKQVGAPRVSALKGDQIAEFLAIVNDESVV